MFITIFNNYSKKFINFLENQQIPFVNYLLTFFCLIQLRIFFESFTHTAIYNLFNTPSLFLLQDIWHFTLFYIFVAMLLTLTFFYATKENIITILKVLLPAFVITVFVPPLDLILSKGMGQHIYYLIPNHTHNLFYYFFTFFKGYAGISLGMRLEIIIVMLLAFGYFRYKQQTIIRSILFTFATYVVIFLTLATPYIVNGFYAIFKLNYMVIPHVMSRYFLIVSFPLGLWIAYLANKKVFLAIAIDARALRLFHFAIMLCIGIALGVKSFTPTLIPQIILLLIAILFFWLFSVMTNNIADQNIDRICNPNRPLITQTIPIELYKNIAYAFLGLSLIYALAVNVYAASIIAGAIAAYAAYSLPPLRLKRIPLFSKAIIACICLAIIILGFYVTTKNFALFPKNFGIIILIGFTAALNLIDLKDYVGDQANNIRTLPVLIGLQNAKLVVGVAFLLANLLFYFYFKNIIYVAIPTLCGILEFYLVIKKNYKENQIIGVYLLNLCFLIVSIVIYAS